MSKKEAVILLNMGGPNNLQEVEVYLKNMFADKNILTMKSNLLRKFIGGMIVFNRTESAQEIYAQLEELFKEKKDKFVTFEEVMDIFPKQPTASNAKKLLALLKKYNINLITSAELAKKQNIEEAKKERLKDKNCMMKL